MLTAGASSPTNYEGGALTIQYPSLDESLCTELNSWLCCALADVIALPTESSVVVHDRAAVLRAVARTQRSIDAVLLYASECRETSQSQSISPHTLALADVATAMCRLLEEEVQIVQDTVMNITC